MPGADSHSPARTQPRPPRDALTRATWRRGRDCARGGVEDSVAARRRRVKMAEAQIHTTEIPPLVVTEIAAGVRVVALFEALKGALVLIAGFGLLALVHRDLEDLAERLGPHSPPETAGPLPPGLLP